MCSSDLWTRRSRAGWRWLDGVEAPLGEESESYDIRLSDADGVFRSHSALSPQWHYEAAMIAADAAAGHSGPVEVSVCQRGIYALGRPGKLNILI